MSEKRKFYRTVYQVEVLSEEKFDESGGLSLTDIDEEITIGHSSGRVIKLIDNEEKTGPEMVALLQNQGSDPEFFRLDKKGNDLEEFED
jgi:hypothetical protein